MRVKGYTLYEVHFRVHLSRSHVKKESRWTVIAKTPEDAEKTVISQLKDEQSYTKIDLLQTASKSYVYLVDPQLLLELFSN